MKDNLIAILTPLIYLGVSYHIHLYIRKVGSFSELLMVALLYIIATFLYFVLIKEILQYANQIGIHTGFANAPVFLGPIFFLCLLITIINIGFAVHRWNIRK